MATSTVESLFGITPEALQAQRDATLQAQALQYAQLDPMQQAQMSLYMGGNRLGGAIGGLLGAKDPELERATAIQQAAQQADLQTPEGMLAYAKSVQPYSPQAALTAAQRAAELRKAQAEAETKALSLRQEEALRRELAQLPPDATPEQITAVVSKYGSADKILATLTASSDKAAQRNVQLQIAQGNLDARVQAAEQAAQTRIQIAQMQGATAQQLAQMRNESNQLIAQMRIQGSKEIAALTAAAKGPKALAPGLQKSEDEDLSVIEGTRQQVEALTPVLSALKADPATGKPLLQLGAINNGIYQAQNFSGKSTPASQAYANLERVVQQATNIKVSAEKGVQTDRDVLRMANELIAAFGKNDNKVMSQAVQNFIDASNKVRTTKQKIIENRRKSQGVEPYGFETPAAQGGVIKLD